MVLSVVPAIGIALVVDVLAHGHEPLFHVLRDRGWVYALLCVAALVVHAQRRRWAEAIDRRYLREPYDARALLEAVADSARRAGSFERAAPVVVARIEAALHPDFAATMLRPVGDTSFRTVASSPLGRAPAALAADGVLVSWLHRSDPPKPLSPQARAISQDLPEEEADRVRDSRIDLVLPVQMADGLPQAMLVLGPKRLEQPYTREDLELLEAVASSLALLLERQPTAPTPAGQAFEECPQCGSCYDSGTPSCTVERSPLVPVGMPRTLAGRYRLERRLGRGGMGKVYEAVDGALDCRVAVKLIRDEWVYSRAAALRFEREARVVAGLAHPNIVTVYDYGVEAGTRAFLVMELLKGVTLREELQRSGRLDAAWALAIVRGVCGAVETAHRRHLVHRDLKPDNIFLVRGGADDGASVKVLDFGIAKPLPPWEDAATPGGADDTETGVLVGTVGTCRPSNCWASARPSRGTSGPWRSSRTSRWPGRFLFPSRPGRRGASPCWLATTRPWASTWPNRLRDVAISSRGRWRPIAAGGQARRRSSSQPSSRHSARPESFDSQVR